ncbi:MAG: TonB-dependent receptor [Acidobacteriota bacterium]
MRISSFFRYSLILTLGAILAATPVLAQTDTGNIEVQTVLSDGQPVPGVLVTATSTSKGVERTAVSTENGWAILRLLTPGTWSIATQLEGLEPQESTVTVHLGQTSKVTFTLAPATVTETIDVVAEAPVIDIFDPGVAANVTPEQIRELPVPDRDFQNLAFTAPGVQRERGSFRFIQGSPVIGSSSNASQASIYVDGVDQTDPAVGLARTRFNQDSIEEFQVVVNRVDTEIGGSDGGVLKVITRSGGNDFQGSIFGFYRDESLRETGELEEDGLDFERTQIGATLGGPFVLDQTHFFTSIEYIDETDFAPVRPGGAFTDLATDVENPFTQWLGLFNLDHQFSAGSFGTLRSVIENYREDNFGVGGIFAESNGQSLDRDSWNLVLGWTKVLDQGRLIEARGQLGHRNYEQPTNSDQVEEWFTFGNTYRTGNNLIGDFLGEGDYASLRGTYYAQSGDHDWKVGASLFHLEERSIVDIYQEGLIVYADDTRNIPLLYSYGLGSSEVDIDTDIVSAWVQDDWRVNERFTLTLGLRYDIDLDGNNPDFEHPDVGDRSSDDDNFQPRLGFVWDVKGDGDTVLRGGAGLFAGRFLVGPGILERQQNGLSGRLLLTNVSFPPFFPLDINDPENTGFPLGPDVLFLNDDYQAPESTQLSLGLSQRLGDTGLWLQLEAVHAEGNNEVFVKNVNFGGNDNPVPLDPTKRIIYNFTSEGRSEYTALILSLDGTLPGGHLLNGSVTWSDKKNISDDYNPAFPSGYPSDPTDVEGEFGRSRLDETWRVVLSGVFRLPWDLTVAPIYQYGSGQPWNRIIGYDFNGDSFASDRLPGVDRNSEDGPDFSRTDLRITKAIGFGDDLQLDLIVEVFNLFNETNFDVASIDNVEFLAGPTLANPDAVFIPNPTFGDYRATLSPREIQIGARLRF